MHEVERVFELQWKMWYMYRRICDVPEITFLATSGISRTVAMLNQLENTCLALMKRLCGAQELPCCFHLHQLVLQKTLSLCRSCPCGIYVDTYRASLCSYNFTGRSILIKVMLDELWHSYTCYDSACIIGRNFFLPFHYHFQFFKTEDLDLLQG